MAMGALGVVERWLDSANDRDSAQIRAVSAPGIEVVGPRGVAVGREVLTAWLERAGFSARSQRWFCGADGSVVVEQHATWRDVATGEHQGEATVASQFLVEDGLVVRYARHDALPAALESAGLSPSDEVVGTS